MIETSTLPVSQTATSDEITGVINLPAQSATKEKGSYAVDIAVYIKSSSITT